MSATPELSTLLTDLDAAGDDVVIGCGLIGLGVGFLFRDPAVRAFCGSVLDRPGVREAFRAVAASSLQRVSELVRQGATPPA